MKIISGKHKSRVINCPISKEFEVRPTMNKVRMSIFNIIDSRKNFSKNIDVIQDSVVLDLCCGYGSLGIEAISRGAKFCYFIDKETKILKILEKNLENLKETANSQIIAAKIGKLPLAVHPCNLIFIDPPYRLFKLADIVKELDDKNWLAPDVIIVSESEYRENSLYSLEKFNIILDRRYGSTKITILEKKWI